MAVPAVDDTTQESEMTQEKRPADVGPDESSKVRDQDTEGHKKNAGDEPLSAKPRNVSAIPDTDEADTEAHKKNAGDEPLSAKPRNVSAIPDTDEADTEGHKK